MSAPMDGCASVCEVRVLKFAANFYLSLHDSTRVFSLVLLFLIPPSPCLVMIFGR